MAAPLFSQVKEFDGEKEECSQYMERLDHFFEVNKVANVDKKRAILLAVITPRTYKLLRNLLAPGKPKDKTYTELVGILKEHHSPKPSETVQRFRFNSWFVSQRSQYLPLCQSYGLLPNFAILAQHSRTCHEIDWCAASMINLTEAVVAM